MHRELRNVDLNLLIVFATLAEEEHLTKTAEKLHLSQPAVSNALSRLRKLFDDELFVRAPNGMRPTQKARALKEPIQQALAIIQNQLRPEEAFDYTTAHKHFSIAVNGYAEFMLFPVLMGHIRRCAPNISLSVMPESDANTPERLRSGELDVAIDYLTMRGKDFIEEAFLEEELVVVAAKDHPALEKGISMKQYNTLPHVSIHPRGHRGSHTEILLGRKQIKRHVVMSVSNLISFPPLVAHSDMICTLPKRLAMHFSPQLPIAIHPLPFKFDKITVYMTYHRDKRKDPAHIWLREQLYALRAQL
ncbi:MAG: LysR substrate-binding domain-containing protein [Oleiphilaceae bacterium]|nr:LysR substrate-binding domain-containing protein [Oleiphilaceae bacterium]